MIEAKSIGSCYRGPVKLMGILNVTPDSFSDGGRYLEPEKAIEKALLMIEEGADIIDVGGESTRPGATELCLQEELDRVLPVITGIRQASDCLISIDSYKTETLRQAHAAGANFINSITALQSPDSLSFAASLDTAICLMHMQGRPKTMQNQPQYDDPVEEINQFFAERIEACMKAGIKKERLILDPGFGFGKTKLHNLQILKRFHAFQKHGCPLLLGVSRKACIGEILHKPSDERLYGGLTMTLYAAIQGLSIIRTHDVAETKQALDILDAIITSPIENQITTELV